jgi:hypothetical protein
VRRDGNACAGRTFLFDLRDPLNPRTAGSFTDVDGYMDPHSYLRLPNQNILATFQHGRWTGSAIPHGAVLFRGNRFCSHELPSRLERSSIRGMVFPFSPLP